MATKQNVCVYGWGDLGKIDYDYIINTDSIIECADWINKFAGNHKLKNDVGLPLERCAIASYQIGYLFDQIDVNDKIAREHYLQEGIASVLLHTIATYELMGREYINLPIFNSEKGHYKWSQFSVEDAAYFDYIKSTECLYYMSEHMFKFQRWVLYNHIGRKKRWCESDFIYEINNLTINCLEMIYMEGLDLSIGFAQCMSKLQDEEIKRH